MCNAQSTVLDNETGVVEGQNLVEGFFTTGTKGDLKRPVQWGQTLTNHPEERGFVPAPFAVERNDMKSPKAVF